MKLHQSTKQQNNNWAYIYLGFAFAMVVTALWRKQYGWYLPAIVLIILAGIRFFWLGKRLKN